MYGKIYILVNGFLLPNASFVFTIKKTVTANAYGMERLYMQDWKCYKNTCVAYIIQCRFV